MNFSYVEGGLLGKRDHKPEMDESFREEKKRLGLVKTTGVQYWQVFFCCPLSTWKMCQTCACFFFLRITACGGVVAWQTRGR